MGKYYFRQYTATTPLEDIERYIAMEGDEVICFSQTAHGMTVLFKAQSLDGGQK